jgi:hypothetical protein
MRTIHDRFAHPICDRLQTTSMGLGLVRLLQDARRFEEAKATLYWLEHRFQGGAEKSTEPSQKTSRANRLAAEMRTQPVSIA